jgi:hypothetical protein
VSDSAHVPVGDEKDDRSAGKISTGAPAGTP